MTPQQIHDHIVATYDDVLPKASWGETSFFVNPGGKLPSGTYFATIKEKDGDNDKASNLDREGVFRLNFGPGRQAFEKLFSKPPARPPKGGIIDGPWNFQSLDTLMPHPVYGWMSWVCVLNPSVATLETLAPLLDLAHKRAVKSTSQKLQKLKPA